MIIPRAVVSVTLADKFGPVLTVDGKDTTYEDTIYMKDQFQKLLGDGQARVSIGVDEKIGGPAYYSSASVRVNITLSCNQDEATVNEAVTLAFEKASEILDTTIPQAMQLLDQHLRKAYPPTQE